MTPEQLKASILQMAMRGKLVEQRSDEGTGAEIYDKIVIERNKLIKAKIIKKIDIDEEVLPETIPFDIPESWKWVKIGMIEEINLGFTYRPEYTEEGISFLSVKDISGGSIDFTRAKKVSQETYDNAAYGSKPYKGDILFGRVGTIGKPQIIETEEPFCIFVSLGFFRDHTNILDKKYVSYWMDTKLFDVQVNENVKGAAQKNLNTNWLKDFLIPLPPLEEQHRIVAKIEELIPYVDRYAEAYEKLKQFNAKFPEDMKKSILQYAIQGKLVEQRPEEGTAEELYQQIQEEKKRLIKEGKIKKEKPLAEIKDDEVPFEIPESWKWCYIGELFMHNTGKAQNSSGSQNGIIRKFITTSNLYWNSFDFTKVKEMPFTEVEIDRCTVKKGDLLVCEGGDYGRSAIWNYDEAVCIQNHIHRLRAYKKLDISYFYYIFYFYKNTGRLKGRGVAIQGLSTEAMHKILIPLPPLEEQHRIVAKIEELMPYCEKLAR